MAIQQNNGKQNNALTLIFPKHKECYQQKAFLKMKFREGFKKCRANYGLLKNIWFLQLGK